MGNYNQNNECAGCGEHISSYHGKGCVYDPDFEPVNKCTCPTCDGKCAVIDEYSEDDNPCEYCFEHHTIYDEEANGFVYLRTINDIKRELEEGSAVNF